MIENIKTLWSLMLKETKRKVVKAIVDSNEFKATDEIYVKQHWIYKGLIPEEHHQSILELFQNALKAQNELVNTSLEN